MRKLGLIVNPIAGMGGKVALKGTDGADVLAAARARGAHPESGHKAARALRALVPLRAELEVLTASGGMGQTLCEQMDLPHRVVYHAAGEDTGPGDTEGAARAMVAAGAELILFAGGDGTARNLCQAVGETVPVLGIPAGVKIQSAVFALDPETAGQIAAALVRAGDFTCSPREVVDLDEDAYRTGRVSATLYGMMRVPNCPQQLQSMKQSGFTREADQMAGIAGYLKEHLEPGVTYAVGSGSTAKCILQRLGLPYELLGVDILRDGALLAKDVTEEQLWSYAREGDMKIIVSPIGGQGFIFGRGNHQFSARVLRAVGKENITVIAPESKILSIAGYQLHADSGDPEVNESLRGYYNVLCGYGYFLSLCCK